MEKEEQNQKYADEAVQEKLFMKITVTVHLMVIIKM